MAEPMPAFDRRVTPWRAEVAAKYLEGKVKAARFVEGRRMEVIAPQASLRREPRPDAPLATEALKGERVTVYDANAVAAPPMSFFMLSIVDSDLMSRPPVSKQTPLPTKTSRR